MKLPRWNSHSAPLTYWLRAENWSPELMFEIQIISKIANVSNDLKSDLETS